MKTTGNTILITGGSAGIGLAMAKHFDELNNQVIIVGRDEERLEQAKWLLPNLGAIKADISNEADTVALFSELSLNYPNLNMLINNAGKAFAYQLNEEGANTFARAADEMLTNYLSVIRLTDLLLPLLKKQPEAAIINVSSVVADVPALSIPTYSASKAALHSYTTSLRLSLTATNISVFEVFPPLVNTNLSKEIGGEHGIHPDVVAQDLINALAQNNLEVRVGDSAKVYELFLSNPKMALEVMNGRQ